MSIKLSETPLNEIFGDNYASEFTNHNRRYVADLIISNIAGMNFKEVKHDYAVLFGDKKELPEPWFQHIRDRISDLRPSLIIRRITDMNAIPRLLNEPQISYFKIFDLHTKNIYIIFITPYIMDAL